MPTQEERLATIEQNFAQFQSDAIKSYQDMAMQVTTTRGLAETTIGRLATMQWQMDQHFNAIETHLNTHAEATNTHLMHLQERADKTDKDLDEIKTTLAKILERLPEKYN